MNRRAVDTIILANQQKAQEILQSVLAKWLGRSEGGGVEAEARKVFQEIAGEQGVTGGEENDIYGPDRGQLSENR